jgi:hypothetical protein
MKKEKSNIQNLWDKTKAILRGKFMPITTYIKKKEHRDLK